MPHRPSYSQVLATAILLVWLLASSVPARAQGIVVVELFTSEGCSSCPPADALLASLSRQRNSASTELVLLGEHVEYWNDLGWRDRFSAPAFTQRQYNYVRQLHLATAFTPQVVIDGRLQTVGGNGGALQKLIAEAARTPKPAGVSLSFVSPDKLRVHVTDSSHANSKVLLAVTEDNLGTTVQAGENSGRTLTHAAVVRILEALGTTADGSFEKVVAIPSKGEWKKADLRLVVLVQDQQTGAIRGAASLPLQPMSPSATGR